MAPNNSSPSRRNQRDHEPVPDLEDADLLPDEDTMKLSEDKSQAEFKAEIVWLNVYWYSMLHILAIYGWYLGLFHAKWPTIAIAVLWHFLGAIGVTAGVHRLWSHRSYKAKLPLRLFLGIAFTIAFQNSIFVWVRDHRVHHKFSETHGDPHNAKRGFFFAHVGWLLYKKHPDVFTKGKTVSMADVIADPVVYYQKKLYIPGVLFLAVFLPTFIPWYYFGESFLTSYFVTVPARYAFTLNMTWLVNSAAHLWGNKPYDKFISPAENLGVALGAIGEGFHNYHHTFPWDYKTAELGSYSTNFTSLFIDYMAKIGQAYDLKTASDDMIRKRAMRTGDGSHPVYAPGAVAASAGENNNTSNKAASKSD